MAVYRFSASIVKRSGGRSATAAAAYRAAERIEDERTGLAHDYRRRGGVEYAEILAPDNAPDWMRDRAQLWNAAERLEKRKDAQLAREIQLSLPHELENWQRAQLVREFVREQFVAKGMVADIALHAPDRQGDNRNHHAHVLLTMRDLLGEGFGKKQRAWNETAQLEEWRDAWAQYQNRALERAGKKERVDHRSLEAQGLDREPEPKIGPHATEMERRGKASERGDERRAVQERNRQREALRKEAEVVDLAIEREKRKQARAARESEQEQYRRAAGKKEGIGNPDHDARQRNADERGAARQKARFELWANRKRAELQNRQLDDRGDLGRRHDKQRLEFDSALAEVYGPAMRQAARKLEEIEERQKAGTLYRFVYRLTGQAGRDGQEAEAARAGIANASQRIREQREKFERKQGADRTEQARSHERQNQVLERRIETARQRREREGWPPLPARDSANGNDRTSPQPERKPHDRPSRNLRQDR